MRLPLSISSALDLAIGGAVERVTPRQGLVLAEELARKSFKAAMAEEAAKHGVPLDRPAPRASRKVSA